jgi:hypothetical protein
MSGNAGATIYNSCSEVPGYVSGATYEGKFKGFYSKYDVDALFRA